MAVYHLNQLNFKPESRPALRFSLLRSKQDGTGRQIRDLERCSLARRTPEEQVIYREEIEGIYTLFTELGLSEFEMKVITTRAEGFITARQIAEVENVNFNRVVKAAVRARKKLLPVLRETAISKGYNPDGNLLPGWGTAAKTRARTSAEITTIQTAKGKTKAL